jgi:hypothetical protein
MALITGCAFRTGMFIILLVTAKTGGRRILELEGRRMALDTGGAGVRAHQLEDTIVIKGGWLPGCRVVTRLAGAAFGSSVFIILLMAADAGGWGTHELQRCCMAFGAVSLGMCTNQFECAIMVERGGLPGQRCMTFIAGGAFTAGMLVIILMAAKTGFWHVREQERGGMASDAVDIGVPTHQL